MLHAFHLFDGFSFFPSAAWNCVLAHLSLFFLLHFEYFSHNDVLSSAWRPQSTKSHQIKIMTEIWMMLKAYFGILNRYHFNDMFLLLRLLLLLFSPICPKLWSHHKNCDTDIHFSKTSFCSRRVQFLWTNVRFFTHFLFSTRKYAYFRKNKKKWTDIWREKLLVNTEKYLKQFK